MDDLIPDEPNPNMTRADLASLKRLEERRRIDKEVAVERRKEAKRKRILKADLMRKTHTKIQDFIKGVFARHELPMDKWGNFYVTGAYTVDNVPGGHPKFKDNDFRIALMLDLGDKIDAILGVSKPEKPVVEKPIKKADSIPEPKKEVKKDESGV